MLQNFSVAISVSPHVCFILVLILISVFLRRLVDRKLVEAPQYFLLLAVPRRLFCFGSLVILDVARCYLWLFTLYINIEIGKNSC